jgi:hypothetical protein
MTVSSGAAYRCVPAAAGPPSGAQHGSDRPLRGGQFWVADVGSGSGAGAQLKPEHSFERSRPRWRQLGDRSWRVFGRSMRWMQNDRCPKQQSFGTPDVDDRVQSEQPAIRAKSPTSSPELKRLTRPAGVANMGLVGECATPAKATLSASEETPWHRATRYSQARSRSSTTR